MIQRFMLGIHLARRELRSGLSGFRIFLACLILGVASIAGVGSLSEALLEGLSREGRELLGGDVELRMNQREMAKPERDWLATQGKVSMSAELRAMAIAQDRDARALIELKAVDTAYPLYGTADVSPRQPLSEVFANREGLFGAAVDERLLAKLGIRQGGVVRIGSARFELRALLRQEPDRVAGGFSLGPRVLISEFALRATGLVQPGSLINFNYRLALPPQSASRKGVTDWIDALKKKYPAAVWQTRDRWNAAPGVRRFIEQVGAFLTLVGLTALVVGGVGVGSAVKSYLDRRRDDIATLKCVGASGRFIFFMFLSEVMALAVIGVGVGLVLGAMLPIVAQMALSSILPFKAQFGLYLAPVGSAAAFGLLTALAFAIWPLARAKEISPAVMFRELVSPARRWPHWTYFIAMLLAFSALIALAVFMSPNLNLAAGFALGTVAAFSLLRIAGVLLMWFARRVPRPHFVIGRLALSNLYRPGAPTAAVILSLGLGLTLLTAIAMTDFNMRRIMREELPAQSPSFFLLDIQSAQVEPLQKFVKETKGIESFDLVPMLRGRIVKVKNAPADKAKVKHEFQWALNGDRALTYGNPPKARDQVIDGAWWPANYTGPAQLSIAFDLADGLGLKVGDHMTINVLGRDIDMKVANLRRVDITNARMNFLMIVSPGTLEKAPHGNLATLGVAHDREDEVERAVANTFSNVSVLRVREAIETADGLLQQLASGIRAASFLTVLTGLLVLAGALAAGHRHRLFDAVVLKVLGATKGQVMTTYLIEFAVLGAVAGFVAAITGTVAAWAVAKYAMDSNFIPSMSTLGAVIVGGALASMALGIGATWTALSTPAARTLRTA